MEVFMRYFQCIAPALLAFLLASVGQAQTIPSYATTFTTNENPISEGGRWINGKAVGIYSTDIQTVPGFAFGTQPGNNGFDDSIALLSGSWAPDQTVQATVHTVNQSLDYFEEVELWLHGTITPSSTTGYEINFRCTGNYNQGYMQIVRWEGRDSQGNPSFAYIDFTGPGVNGVKDGDIVKASIRGTVITVWVNGIQVAQASDNTFTSGNPGMGFFLMGATGVNADYGFLNFSASGSGTTNFGPSAQPNTRILRGDFNGDGRNDILWQNTDGSVAIWLMNGLNAIGGASLLGPNTGWSVQQIGDFNGDGKSDILWLNADGSSAIWLMDGLNVIGGSGILGPNTGWSVKKVADLNGDGKSDLIWENIDGSAAIWLMDGMSAISGVGIIGPGTGWSVVETGDFNHDGKADLVWQNIDGSSAIWLMDGLNVISGAGLLGPGTGWSIVHTGDFNGDGNTDIVWQNSDGSSAIWLMSGISQIGGFFLSGPASGWVVTRIGDFNADGRDDLVWQNNNDGRVAVSLMNGTVMATGDLLGPGTGWSVNRLGDFTGDGKIDIVWRHVDGSSGIWLMDGLAPTGGSILLGSGTGWVPGP
jgi:hypothetical protein